MSAMVQFFTATGFMIELLCVAMMFTWWAPRRKYSIIRGVSCAGLSLVALWGWQVAPVPQTALFVIARLIVCYLLCYVFLRTTFNLNIRQAGFYTTSSLALQHIVYSTAQIIRILSPSIEDTFHHINGENLLYPALIIPLMILAYILFARPLKDNLPERIGGRFLVMTVGVALCVGVFSSLFDSYINGLYINPNAYLMFVLTRIITCVFLLLMLREVAERESAQRDNAILHQLLEQQKGQLESDKETIALINIKTHDLKKQLSLLNGRISQSEIDEMQDLVRIYDSSIRTGNESLDVVLTNKALICEQRGIQLDRMVDGTHLDFMAASDVYSLFGNALDNAMEAVTSLDDPQQRYIRLTVRANKGMLVIHVENPFKGEREFVDGIAKTTKDDRNYHGFGMQSMRMLTHRYNGTMSVTTRGQIFIVNIVLPLRDRKRDRK
ncbi:GHKL domain-containing protein [Alloscardovia theropitheci]|uniref:GHKL domain-containing protein n=1 Tax=Alloscardovia theropitheci TaxID=2496842 RepID=A0A4R0QPQ9_9BIFI|nr:ATP-binding protein [Alloscardovia theropitheci]TCD54234.1 GHKL domain-containing protein [Alloscardovia theropitheci]